MNYSLIIVVRVAVARGFLLMNETGSVCVRPTGERNVAEYELSRLMSEVQMSYILRMK